MERAVFIASLRQLKYLRKEAPGSVLLNSGNISKKDIRCTRLYYGIEFCERLLPAISSLKRVLLYVKKNRLDFSFVTPYVTDKGMRCLKTLFDMLKKEKVECEVIINDWGVLSLVNRLYPNLSPVTGRLLVKQKRGPRVVKLLQRKSTKTRYMIDAKNPHIRSFLIEKKLPPAMEDYYKGSNMLSVPLLQRFLLDRNVNRIETDNLLQGVSARLPQKKMAASVYYPFLYISTTFFCPSAGCGDREKSFLPLKPCGKECQRYIFILRHKTMPKKIFLRGNTIFCKNSVLSEKRSKENGVDRIVYEPEPPL